MAVLGLTPTPSWRLVTQKQRQKLLKKRKFINIDSLIDFTRRGGGVFIDKLIWEFYKDS